MKSKKNNPDLFLGKDSLGRNSWLRHENKNSSRNLKNERNQKEPLDASLRRQQSDALHSLSQNDVGSETTGSGAAGYSRRQPLTRQEEKELFRRNATVKAIANCSALDQEERKILNMRFGATREGVPQTLEEVAEIFGVGRTQIRKVEVEAMKKVRSSDPDLDAMYTTAWLRTP